MINKYYYDENVYRISGGTNSFKEIAQTGLECIGDIGNYEICYKLSVKIKLSAGIARVAPIALERNAKPRFEAAYVHACQARAAVECVSADTLNIVREGNARQISAIEECTFGNSSYLISVDLLGDLDVGRVVFAKARYRAGSVVLVYRVSELFGRCGSCRLILRGLRFSAVGSIEADLRC